VLVRYPANVTGMAGFGKPLYGSPLRGGPPGQRGWMRGGTIRRYRPGARG
jgi:hypothetical protein